MKVDYLVYAIGATISYINVSLIYGKINNYKFRFNIFYILLFIVLGILNAFINIHFPIGFKPLYNFLCFGISIKLFSKESFKGIIYYVFFIWFVGILLDILFMALFSVFFEYLLKIWPVWGILFISLFLQLVLNLIFRIKRVNLLVIKIKDKLKLINNFVWIFILSVFLVILFGVFAFKNLNSISSVVLFIFLIALSLSFIVFLLKILYEEKVYKITIDNLLENNNYYVDLNNRDRVFKHNLIHNLNSIKTVSNEKSKLLLEDLIKEVGVNNTNKDIDNLPDGINGLICKTIYSKSKKKLNIAINNYLKSDLFGVLTPRKYNKLCEAISLSLDNAISASEKSKERILQIVLLEEDNYVKVKIINTFQTFLEIDKLGTLDYSTKKDGHGLGLYSLLSRKDLRIKTSIINNLFENQIIVKKTSH